MQSLSLSLCAALLLCGIDCPALAFDIEAHRGGRALHPENTLQAFTIALALRVDTLELDVGVTRDGVLWSRTNGGSIPISPAMPSAIT